MSVSARPELAQLRELLGSVHIPQACKPRHAFSLVEGGLPKGAVVELSGEAGSGKSELVLRFLAENPELRAAWIEPELTVYPCAFPQHGVRLERVLFSEAGAHALWATQQILRSQLFEAVILSTSQLRGNGAPVYPLFNSEMNLRRLQLAAERTGSTVILLSDEPTPRAWPITLQLQLENGELRVLKAPAGRAGMVTSFKREA